MVGRGGLAAQRAFFRRGRHSPPTWRASASARKATVPPTCARELRRAIRGLSAAMHRRMRGERIAPVSRAARRSRARASKAARSAASSNRLAWRRGRTIWRKPKPLTAVRSNGCGRMASTASATACRARLAADGGQVDADRSADAVAADRARAAACAPASASCSGGKVPSTSIRVIAGVSDTRSSPPGKATIPLRASSSRSDQPAASSASVGEGKAGQAKDCGRAGRRRHR